MTTVEAADLAARTLAAIDQAKRRVVGAYIAADRERVASDLAGLRDAVEQARFARDAGRGWTAWQRAVDRYADGLRRTARLYGVAE